MSLAPLGSRCESRSNPRGMTRAGLEGSPVLTMTPGILAELEGVALTIGLEREACGVLAGAIVDERSRVVTAIAHLPSLPALSRSFAISVEGLVTVSADLRASGLQPVALFHTHPSGSARPSDRDARLPRVTGLASLI